MLCSQELQNYMSQHRTEEADVHLTSSTIGSLGNGIMLRAFLSEQQTSGHIVVLDIHYQASVTSHWLPMSSADMPSLE
jgi:hypothetical protein